MRTYTERFNKAEELYHNGSFEEAQSLFKELWKEASDGDAAFMFANCLKCLGREDEAKRVYSYIIEIDPLWEAPIYNLAEIYYNHAEYERAMELYCKAADADDNNGDACFKIGECCRMLCKVDEAITYYIKAVEASENTYLFESHYYLGIGYLKNEKYASAFEHLVKANEIKPEDAETLFFMGLCCESLENYDKAIEFYEQALNIKPSCNTHINAGFCYFDKGNFKLAVAHLKAAYELEKDNVDALFYYCYLLIKNNQENEAYTLLKSAEINFDNDERILDLFVCLALNQRDFDISDSVYEKLKLISPDCETITEYSSKKAKLQVQ